MDISSSVVQEEGTAVVECVFTDEVGSPVAPNELKWTLSDRQGNVINSREDVVVAAQDLAATVYIILSGADLALLTDETGDTLERIITLKGTYDSTFGTDLPLRHEQMFYLNNLVNVS